MHEKIVTGMTRKRNRSNTDLARKYENAPKYWAPVSRTNILRSRTKKSIELKEAKAKKERAK